MTHYIAAEKQVIVKPLKQEAKSATGLHLPGSLDDKNPAKGEVVAVGDNCPTFSGHQLVPGAIVFYYENMAVPFYHDLTKRDRDFDIIPANAILMLAVEEE
jgi:co-chaperonin GroES (HSP10)